MSLVRMQSSVLPGIDRDEWLDRRRKGLGASESAMALGLSPFGTAVELYLRKIGRWAEPELTEAMELGTMLEPVLAQLYQRRSGRRLDMEQVFVQGLERPHLLATLDAVNDRGEPVEFKTISAWKAGEVGEEGSDAIPDHWRIQAHQQMHLWGAEAMDFGVLIGGQQFRILRIPRCDALLKAMLPQLDAFWNCVTTRTEPEWVGIGPVPEPRVLAALYPGCSDPIELGDGAASAVDHWRELGRDIKALHDERDATKAFILAQLKDAAYGRLPDGRIVRRDVRTIPARTQTVNEHTRVDLRINSAKGE